MSDMNNEAITKENDSENVEKKDTPAGVKPDNQGLTAYAVNDPSVVKAIEKVKAKAEKQAAKATKKAEKDKQKEIAGIDKYDDLIEAIKDDDMKTIAKLLVEIKKDNEKTRKYAKRQSICAICSTVLCLILVTAILYCGFKIVPMVEDLANQATVLVNNTNDLIQQTGDVVTQATSVIDDAASMVEQTAIVVDNLEKITTDIAATDLKGLVNDVNSLVVTSEESINEAVQKIEDIDIDTLNKAISDLQAVVEPLSKLFRR